MKSIIHHFKQHLFFIAVIYASLLIFFHSVIFDGKTYTSADTIAAHSWETLCQDADSEGSYPLWNPYIFCGMPTVGSATLAPPLEWYEDMPVWAWGRIKLGLTYIFFRANEADYFVMYLLYGIGIYLFAFRKFGNKFIALFVALAGIYSSRVILLVMIGHFTKLAVLAWMPFVLLMIDKIYTNKLENKKNILMLTGILAVILRLMTAPAHVQFIYYIYLAAGMYFMIFTIWLITHKQKEKIKYLATSFCSLAIATILALAMGATQWLSMYEYQKYSIRGSNQIERAK